jgi:hydrogenase-4 component F
MSEFYITSGAFSQNHPWLGATFLFLLGGIFLAMSDTVVKMIFGTPDPKRVRTPYVDTAATTAPLIVALGLALVLGVWLPQPLATMLQSASTWVEGKP